MSYYPGQAQALNVLKAELAYLSGPERVAELARLELGLAPVTTKQVISLDDLQARFPLTVQPAGELR